MSQRKRRFESDDEDEEEDVRPPEGDSETDDPEEANNMWEIQTIRSHYPIEATRGDPVYYWVQWKLRRGQVEDWDDDENWVIDKGMKCPNLLNEYWNYVEKQRRKGRKIPEILPPKTIRDEIKKREKKIPRRTAFASKMCRRIVLSDDEEEEKIVDRKQKKALISDDEEEEVVRPKRAKSTPIRPKRKRQLTWQEKLNLQLNDDVLDAKDITPELLSDEARQAAILLDATTPGSSRGRREKPEDVLEFERKRQMKLEVIRMQTQEKKTGESKRRLRLESSSSSSDDGLILPKNTPKDFTLTTHWKRPSPVRKSPVRKPRQDRVEIRPDAVGIAALKQKLEERMKKQPGQFKPKESLLEEIHPPHRPSERPPPAGPSAPVVSDRFAPYMPLELPLIESDSSTDNHDFEASPEPEEAPPEPAKAEESGEEEEEEVTRKRMLFVHLSDVEDDAEEESARREEKPTGVETKPVVKEQKPHVVVENTLTETDAASSAQQPSNSGKFEQLDIKPDITKLGPLIFKIDKRDSDADSDIQPCLQNLEDGDLVIAEEDTDCEAEEAQKEPNMTEKDQKLRATMNKMMARFQSECFARNYKSVERNLKPIYVIKLAENLKNGEDMAMTVFDQETKGRPRFVCEMVKAKIVAERNMQLIIDCEERNRQEETASKAIYRS